jgi:hypothetical protein
MDIVGMHTAYTTLYPWIDRIIEINNATIVPHRTVRIKGVDTPAMAMIFSPAKLCSPVTCEDYCEPRY